MSCACTVLHAGLHCNKAIKLPKDYTYPAAMKKFYTYFSGSYVLNKDSIEDISQLIIRNPEKDKPPLVQCFGFRV